DLVRWSDSLPARGGQRRSDQRRNHQRQDAETTEELQRAATNESLKGHCAALWIRASTALIRPETASQFAYCSRPTISINTTALRCLSAIPRSNIRGLAVASRA